VAELLLADVFDHGFDADLHGGTEGAVDAGFEDQEVADFDGGDEVEVVHGGGDGEGAGVAAGGHGTDEVDELHEAAAEKIAERVAVGGEDNLAALGLGVADGAGCGSFGHASIVMGARRSAVIALEVGAMHPTDMDKIAMLTEILRQNPTDAFARYGLAMAYAAEGKMDEALREFEVTTEHNPDYVPAYQMSAQTLMKVGRSDDAKARLQAGMAACARTGNSHAASEMGAMLEELGSA
jgi:hypothetical protein